MKVNREVLEILIKKARKTQLELAKQIGMAPNAFYNAMQKSAFSEGNVNKIAINLGVKPWEFVPDYEGSQGKLDEGSLYAGVINRLNLIEAKLSSLEAHMVGLDELKRVAMESIGLANKVLKQAKQNT